MSALAIVVQLAGGILLAPLLPGLIQHWKARLQGRRGPTPFQPYRELRRLWGKSSVEVEGSGIVYRLAPSVTAASLALAVLLVPVAAGEPSLGVGRDVLALLAMLRPGTVRRGSRSVGRRERLCADGREPRSDDRDLHRRDVRARVRRSPRSLPTRRTCPR